MFYFFSKTITYLLTPAGWLIGILALAFLTKNVRRHRQFVGLAFGVFFVLGNAVFTNQLALWWEYPIQATPLPPTDSIQRVAVLLTGGMINGMTEIPANDANRTNRFILGPEADRAGQALYLYKTGAVRKILISGGAGNLPFQAQSVSNEGRIIARFLRVAGVRPDDIMLEQRSRNTHENAVFSAQVLLKMVKTNQCVLVTSAWHMRRAVDCFQKEGIRVQPFPAAFISEQPVYLPGDYLLPREEAFLDAYYLIRELVGYVTYWVMGYV